MAKKRGKLLWAGGSTCTVVDTIDEFEGFRLVRVANGDGEQFVCLLDREGRNVGQGDVGDSALAHALKAGHLRSGHERIVKAYRKGQE